MEVHNLLAVSNDDFLANSIRCWQSALAEGDMIAFRYWAVHAFCFARTLTGGYQ